MCIAPTTAPDLVAEDVHILNWQSAFAVAHDSDGQFVLGVLALEPIDNRQDRLNLVADYVPPGFIGHAVDPLAMRHIGHPDARNSREGIVAVHKNGNDDLNPGLGEVAGKLRSRTNAVCNPNHHFGCPIGIRQRYHARYRLLLRLEEQSSACIPPESALGLLRQHIRSTDRIHGIVTDGGAAPNVVPAHTAARYIIRSETLDQLDELRPKVYRCFEAGGLATGAKVEIMGGDQPYAEMHHDPEMAALYRANLEALGRVFANLGEWETRPTGSTDMGMSHGRCRLFIR